MSRLLRGALLAALPLALTACSGSFFTARVAAWETDIANTFGTICYQRVEPPSSPVPFGSATYRADATYDTSAILGSGTVTLRFYGRATDPGAPCVQAGADDRQLSDDVTLDRGSATPIEVGGATYGAAFAELAQGGPFWLGASAEGNVAFGASEVVRFGEGTLSVGF